MAERSSNIGSGAVAVVGQGLAVNSDASWAVAFVGKRFVVGSIFAGAERLIDSRLDFVLRQRVTLGLFNSSRQRGVVVGVGVATLFRRHGNVTGKLAEQGRTLGVLGSFAVLRGCPLRVT